MSAEKLQLFLSTTKTQEMRRLAEEIGVVNDDQSFDEFLHFLEILIMCNPDQVGYVKNHFLRGANEEQI